MLERLEFFLILFDEVAVFEFIIYNISAGGAIKKRR